MMEPLNLNARPDPLLAKLPKRSDQVTRIALIAIPFLSLYQPTRVGVSLITGSLQVISLWKNEQQKKSEKLLKSSAYAIMVYFSIYRPKATLAITLSVQTFSDIKEKRVYDILSRMIYFYSIYSRRPEFIVASLAFEGAKELKEAYQEYKDEKYPEAIAKLLMVALRCYQTKEEVSRLSRRYFGKTITQEDWDQLSKEQDLSKALKEKNYSDVIKDIKVKPLPKGQLSKMKDMVFERVDFSESDLSRSTIENVTFNHCKMKDVLLYKVELIQVAWNHCQLNKGTFYRCYGTDLTFKGCDLTRFCMSESTFSKMVIETSTLYGASFLNVLLKESILKDCDLVDVLLCHANFMQVGCSENRMTKPVIALTWDFEHRGSWGSPVQDVLEDQGALTLKFPIYPEDVDSESLANEVQGKLKNYSTYQLSRPQELLDDPERSPEIEKIQMAGAQVMSYADGVILSGGEDVQTEFYSNAFNGVDYRRSVMEFAVIHPRKPVLGICRGSQVLNTYFGGTIKDVGSQHVEEPLDYNQSDPLGKKLASVVRQPMIGISAHHQAVDRIGRDLQVVLTKRGIVKAFMNRDHSVIGTQFHPERYINERLTREKMKQADLESVVFLLASNLFGRSDQFFHTGPLLTGEETPQLTSRGEEAIIKYCNQSLQRTINSLKKLRPNQIFFKIFLDRVRSNRGDPTPQQLESVPVG